MTSNTLKGFPYYDMYRMTKNQEPVFLNVSVNDEGEMEHSHEFFELLAILSGSGTHWINGKTYQVMPGDIFLLNIGDRHYFNPLSQETEFRWINIGWLPDFYQLEDAALLKNKKYTDRVSMNITNLLMDCLYEYNLKQEEYLDIIRFQLMAILKKLKRLTAQEEISYNEKHRRNLIKRATAFIGDHYREPLTLRDIAERLGISQVYLCKLFSDEIGMGAIQYLRKTRIDKACSLLLSTNMRVNDISISVGFADSKSFFSAFKSQMGITPTQYKKHYEKRKAESQSTESKTL